MAPAPSLVLLPFLLSRRRDTPNLDFIDEINIILARSHMLLSQSLYKHPKDERHLLGNEKAVSGARSCTVHICSFTHGYDISSVESDEAIHSACQMVMVRYAFVRANHRSIGAFLVLSLCILYGVVMHTGYEYCLHPSLVTAS
ncbi:hypothetical protein F5876DRAFT_69271 [Lentinula aff. lateritia]|uniref:Uncharacterized protein n=1 Tax=Lentinula aff. lateritia TaxID=2804960 RepID=A0ACC1TNC6_9AGAR|nr:hypothetical protein F5876DRAFT_69271 [Lentinula aff. lateritia]